MALLDFFFSRGKEHGQHWKERPQIIVAGASSRRR